MGWKLNDLNDRTNAPLAIFKPSGYMFANQGTQHVVYQGFGDGGGDGHIHELWWQNGWHHNDLTTNTHAPLVTFEPSGYLFTNQGTQHVIYQGFVPGQGDDGRVHELWWDGDGWHHSDLTTATNARGQLPPVINSPFGYDFNGQHVVYEGGDNHINYLEWDPDNGWENTDLTLSTSAGVAAALPPTAYGFKAQNTRHVLYLGTDGHVHELWWQHHQWHHNDLTNDSHAPLPLASDQPTGFAVEDGGTQLIHYRGTNGHVYQLWWDSTGWHPLDMTANFGGPAAVSGASPAGYVFPFEGTLHVDYLGTDSHIHEYWRDGSGWHYNDLTNATGAPLAISNPTAYVFPAQNTQHVVFNAANHHIIELFWVPA